LGRQHARREELILASNPVVKLLYGNSFSSAATPLVLLTVAAFASVIAGQVNQLMLLCDLERGALLLNAAWLIAWVTVGVSGPKMTSWAMLPCQSHQMLLIAWTQLPYPNPTGIPVAGVQEPRIPPPVCKRRA